MKEAPFERARAERVSLSLFFLVAEGHNSIQKSGKAKPSLLGQLLDEYDAVSIKDAEHEDDLKLIGAVQLTGENAEYDITKWSTHAIF